MSLFNVIIGFFDGSGTSEVSTGRFYGLRGNPDTFKGQSPASEPLKAKCLTIPTVFTGEINANGVPMARVGWITNIVTSGRSYRVSYRLPSGIPPIRADRLANALGLTNPDRGIGDMQHSHWTLMEGDLFKLLFDAGLIETVAPTIFAPVLQPIKTNLVSAMMPFSRDFDGVYETITAAAAEAGAEASRADNIWEDSTIIQDIYSLIFRSTVVVCDFSGKNANVFYEAGIAHTLGKPLVPIVQYKQDIPFDLQQHRAIIYNNNEQGLEYLKAALAGRLKTLLA